MKLLQVMVRSRHLVGLCIGIMLAGGAASAATSLTPTEGPTAKGTWRLLGQGLGEWKDFDGTQGSLSTGVGYATDWLDVSALFRLGAGGLSLDTQEKVASFLLSPETAPRSIDLRIISFRRMREDASRAWGFYGRITAASSIWKLAEPDAEGVSERKVTLVSASAGYTYRLAGVADKDAAGKDSNNEVALLAGIGLTTRIISGDVSNHEEFRRLAVGTSQQFFLGAEPSITLKVNGVGLTASIPYMIANDLDGVNGFQFLLALDVGGAIKIM
jgi:hypothetical protein